MGVHAFSSVPSASSLGWTIEKLYALYASKNRLCTLCGNTTPELTAYNAYRNANRRVRRAEGTKMYAVGDAYKAHTSAYKHKKERKEGESFFYFFFILPVLPSSTARDLQTIKLSLFASSGNPRQTVNDSFTACFADSGLFWAFIARLTGRPPSSRQFSCFYDHCAFCGHVRIFPSASLPGWTIGSCMHCMHQKTDYALYVGTQLRN